MPFQTHAKVRFNHVDAAGIVFYPRYYEMLNAAVEDWFAQALGADFRTMHGERGIGVPTVQLSSEFVAPSRLGDDLVITLTPRRVGTSSCAYDAVFACGDEVRVRATGTLVCMDLKAYRAVAWPADIRAGLIAGQVPAEPATAD